MPGKKKETIRQSSLCEYVIHLIILLGGYWRDNGTHHWGGFPFISSITIIITSITFTIFIISTISIIIRIVWHLFFRIIVVTTVTIIIYHIWYLWHLFIRSFLFLI